MWRLISLVTLLCVCSSFGQQPVETTTPPYSLELHEGLSQSIGNFSVEILYHTAVSSLMANKNLVISPLTMWIALAVTNEGADGRTSKQIKDAIRSPIKKDEFGKIARWLKVNGSTVELQNINTIFVDVKNLMERDFRDVALRYYETQVNALDFQDKVGTANTINKRVSDITRGRIPKLVDSADFEQAQMLLISALYFKGQWTSPFNATQTAPRPFFDSNGKTIGTVNMMYNRYTYPFANIRELEARVIELPYGKENRLSMLIMLPNPNVSLENMFLKFATVPLDKVFQELRISQSEYSDDEVDCFIPRFKIESDLVLNSALNHMGIYDMFNPAKARLPKVSRVPVYVSKVIHKAEIEVNEEGTTASAVTAIEFANRIGIIRFEANRPFLYMIIEKVTNSIVFGGVYRQPSLY
ncbi:leukocyte elastase inhibitor-like [Plutella xylostella]|uniref:leukocyte elastase inhibitor-like n=1 Tax=Plutella xylostella TaxID=51655 RepID=UPI0020323155|nr:leukocyte elastase inhibitor-like [Plutella xylostella]